LLTALTAIRSFDEEQVVRRIIVGLPVTVLHHQDLHRTQPAGGILAALDADLSPQPEDLRAASLELKRMPARDRRKVLAVYARLIAYKAQEDAKGR
jgi:hypothetical protein